MGTHTNRELPAQAALDALRRIVQALRESSRWAERHVGLSGAQLFVLQKLAEAPAASVNDLARRTRTHQSTVSTVVARLVARGLVRRKASGRDRRSVELVLSARGQRAAVGVPDAPQERLIRAIDALPAARRRQLASALGDVARAMDGSRRAPAMFFEDRAAVRTRSARD